MDNKFNGIIIIFLVINIAAFLAMLSDKLQSRKNNAERISEGLLFFLATIFGSIGVYAGMFTFRHKTTKWHFIIGIPLLMIQNIAFLFLAYLFLDGRI